MDNVAFYISDPSLIGSKVLDTLPGILSYNTKSDKQAATGMLLHLNTAIIDCNFMENTELEKHLMGLSVFVSGNLAEGVDLSYARARISQVRLVVGCVINPGFDSAREVFNFIKHYNRALNSMLFYNSTLFDYDMETLATLN